MGQKLYADEQAEPPRTCVMELRCDCGKSDCEGWRFYIGHDYIEMRSEATRAGWRRADNKWFFQGHE